MTETPDAIRVTRLPSGLTVVTERMDRVETVSLGAYVATGTRHETAEENGVSHFLEHMAFKGTGAPQRRRHRRGDRGGGRPHQRLHRARADRLLRQGAEGGHWLWAPTSSATS